MADINRDLDRYLRKRNNPSTFNISFESEPGESIWSGFFGSKEEEKPKENLSAKEMEKLEDMEEDIKKREAQIEVVREYEHELEEEQDKKVSLYHQVLGFFGKKHRPQPKYDDLEEVDLEHDDDATQDFRILASIYLRWLERLPKRARDEFMESEDYEIFSEILERRGVARRK